MTGAIELERRYERLLRHGFERAAADKVFEALNLPSIDNIDAKIAGLRERGFTDPVKLITSLPAILGLAFDNITRFITKSPVAIAGLGSPRKVMLALYRYRPDLLPPDQQPRLAA